MDALELPRNFGTDRLPMKKPKKKDPVREDRIENEAIADANGPEEQVMGWYYYLDDKIRFPFPARGIAAKVVSPLRKGETVEVQRMAPEDACSAGTVGLGPFPFHNWFPLTPPHPPQRPLATGFTGWRRATASEPRPPAAITQPCRKHTGSHCRLREKRVSARINDAVTKKPRPNILRRTTSRANVATFAPTQKCLGSA